MTPFIYCQKKSKFLGYLVKITSKEDIENAVKNFKKEHPKAKHIIYAAIWGTSGQNAAINDDKEPCGSKAIYELLKKRAISGYGIFIVRYFGGTLLGSGPLMRAYLTTAIGTLDTQFIKDLG